MIDDDIVSDDRFVECWNCHGTGECGSACIDDLCYGRESCIHDGEGGPRIRCDWCYGKGGHYVPWDSPEED